MRKRERRNQLTTVILNYVLHNLREFLLIFIIFLIGITLGVIYVNHLEGDAQIQIQNYIQNFIRSITARNCSDWSRKSHSPKSDCQYWIGHLVMVCWFYRNWNASCARNITLQRFFTRLFHCSSDCLFRGSKRNNLRSFIYFVTEYNLYSMPNLFGSKWNEVI